MSPVLSTVFQNSLAQNGVTLQNLMQELGTWAGAKADLNANFDFGGPQAVINAAVASFESAVQGIVAI